MIFWVFISIFFRTNGKKEQVDENNLSHGHGNDLKSAILRVTRSKWLYCFLKVCSKFFLSNYETHRQRHLKDALQLKILWTWINIRGNSLLGKYHETKRKKDLGKLSAVQKSEPVLQRTLRKDISIIIVFLFLSQTSPILKFNLVLIKYFLPQSINLSTFWYSVYLEVYPVLLSSFIRTSIILIRINIFFRIAATKCSYFVLNFHEPFVPVSSKGTSDVNNSL